MADPRAAGEPMNRIGNRNAARGPPPEELLQLFLFTRQLWRWCRSTARSETAASNVIELRADKPKLGRVNTI